MHSAAASSSGPVSQSATFPAGRVYPLQWGLFAGPVGRHRSFRRSVDVLELKFQASCVEHGTSRYRNLGSSRTGGQARRGDTNEVDGGDYVSHCASGAVSEQQRRSTAVRRRHLHAEQRQSRMKHISAHIFRMASRVAWLENTNYLLGKCVSELRRPATTWKPELDQDALQRERAGWGHRDYARARESRNPQTSRNRSCGLRGGAGLERERLRRVASEVPQKTGPRRQTTLGVPDFPGGVKKERRSDDDRRKKLGSYTTGEFLQNIDSWGRRPAESGHIALSRRDRERRRCCRNFNLRSENQRLKVQKSWLVARKPSDGSTIPRGLEDDRRPGCTEGYLTVRRNLSNSSATPLRSIEFYAGTTTTALYTNVAPRVPASFTQRRRRPCQQLDDSSPHRSHHGHNHRAAAGTRLMSVASSDASDGVQNTEHAVPRLVLCRCGSNFRSRLRTSGNHNRAPFSCRLQNHTRQTLASHQCARRQNHSVKKQDNTGSDAVPQGRCLGVKQLFHTDVLGRVEVCPCKTTETSGSCCYRAPLDSPVNTDRGGPEVNPVDISRSRSWSVSLMRPATCKAFLPRARICSREKRTRHAPQAPKVSAPSRFTSVSRERVLRIGLGARVTGLPQTHTLRCVRVPDRRRGEEDAQAGCSTEEGHGGIRQAFPTERKAAAAAGNVKPQSHSLENTSWFGGARSGAILPKLGLETGRLPNAKMVARQGLCVDHSNDLQASWTRAADSLAESPTPSGSKRQVREMWRRRQRGLAKSRTEVGSAAAVEDAVDEVPRVSQNLRKWLAPPVVAPAPHAAPKSETLQVFDGRQNEGFRVRALASGRQPRKGSAVGQLFRQTSERRGSVVRQAGEADGVCRKRRPWGDVCGKQLRAAAEGFRAAREGASLQELPTFVLKRAAPATKILRRRPRHERIDFST